MRAIESPYKPIDSSMSARCLSGLVVVYAKFRSRNAPREKPSKNAAKIVEVEYRVEPNIVWSNLDQTTS